ncbi:MAG: AsmA family protein, partial [Alphaproteobacteria bacterium]|nr:AsmA family protein [Alphaproteobacteria bacterium]
MKKLLIIIFGLVVLAMIGLTIYVATIDWNKHKNVIAEQFNLSTGKKIVFEGPISFQILPKPYLKATNVKIMNVGSNDVPLVKIPNLVARLALVPLLKGNFEVQRMNLQNPLINVEVLPDAKLNWQSDLTPEQRRNVEEAKFALNSVSIQNAVVNYDDQIRDVGFKLENLNGEISAQSVLGPYRFEGNYVKDNNPQGFAISMGKLSDSMSTSLNMVVTHPMSESYVRFDGSFMISNRVLNGNLIVEAKKLRQFVDANFNVIDFEPQYDMPLVATSDISLNSQQLNLANVVVKYGETQGAGTIQMPFNDGFGNGGVKPRIDAAFNFTDLDVTPIIISLQNFVDNHDEQGKEYAPDFPVDILADVKSLRTVYNGQQIKNFELSSDVVSNVITINNLRAIVPGDSEFKLKGTVSSVDGELFYNLTSSLSSGDFLRTLNWLNIEPTVSAASTYRKADISAGLSGTLQQIYIKPLSISIDKTSFSGEIGIKRGERDDIMAILNADMVNFDNYIPNLPAEEQKKTWRERMLYRFSELGWLNDFDLQISTKMNLAIYENMPLEKFEAELNLLDGKMQIEKLQIMSIAGATMDLSGEVGGFGQTPSFNELNYNVGTNEVSSLIDKLELNVPDFDYKKIKDFSAQGIMTGNMQKFATQSNLQLGNLNFEYSGQVEKSGVKNLYKGDLKFSHPNLEQMLSELKIDYLPRGGLSDAISWQSKIEGDIDDFMAENVVLNIGRSDFRGNFNYSKPKEGVPAIKTNLEINKFELERFLPKNTEVKNPPLLGIEVSNSDIGFLAKPMWSKSIIDYDWLQKFDLQGEFKVSELVAQKYIMNDVEAKVDLKSGVVDVSAYKAKYLGADVDANFRLLTKGDPKAEIVFKLKNLETNKFRPSGSVYGISEGKVDVSADIRGDADNEASFLQTLSGEVLFNFNGINIKGWNLQSIYDDIVRRENTEGLVAKITNDLKSGNTDFSEFTGKFQIKNGVFNLVDTKMLGKNNVVNLSGDVRPLDWDMNVMFEVEYDEPQYMPSFGFYLKGNMEAPVLEVDVDALFELYKSKEDKRNAEIKATAEAEASRLRGIANEHKRTADAMIADIRNNLEPEVVAAKQNVFSGEANIKYTEILAKITSIVKALAQNSMELEDANMDEIALENKNNVNRIQIAKVEQLRHQLMEIKLADAKERAQSLYNQIVEKYNQAKMQGFTYNSYKEKFAERLAAIVTGFKLEDDVNIVGWQNFLEDKIKEFEN